MKYTKYIISIFFLYITVYSCLIMSKMVLVFLFVYLDNGKFPLSFPDEFIWPIYPAIITVVVYFVTAIFIPNPADNEKQNNIRNKDR